MKRADFRAMMERKRAATKIEPPKPPTEVIVIAKDSEGRMRVVERRTLPRGRR